MPEAVEPLNIKERKLCIVADSTTAELYGAELKEILKETCTYVSMFVSPGRRGKQDIKYGQGSL